MDMKGSIIALYIASGALELLAVAVTAWDLRGKRQAASAFDGPLPSSNIGNHMVEQQAAATGGTTWGQMERAGSAIQAALDGARLRTAACLLVLGIALGTLANVLSALRSS